MDISPELQYLSSKRTAMANPSTKYDDLYYSRLNSTMSIIQSQANIGKWRQNLSSPEFGGSSTITLPKGNFIGTCFLHLQLPAVINNQCLSRGHLYMAIKEINYQVGSSNLNNITISGKSLFHLLMGQANTSEQLNKIFRIGGDEKLVPGDGASEGDIIIPLPWSSFTGGQYQKLPFDTALLSQPLQITITFNPANKIIGGVEPFPDGFTEAYLYFKEEILTNRELGMAAILKQSQNEDMISAYPFIHPQLYQSPVFAGKAPGSDPVILNLQAFLNSDLFGLLFSLHFDGDEVNPGGVVPANARPVRAFNSVEPYNVRLEYNGETIYYAPGYSFKLHNMSSIIGDPVLENSYINSFPAQDTSAPTENYVVFMDLSRMRAASFHNHWPNTPKLPNEVLTLSFNTPDNLTYRAYVTYLYPGIIETRSDGQVEIYYS